ncbi:MerR family transcriptional regulator [Peribacillus cavernae]|uniref:Mercuric resistance operon regulatory protein n=1 Tax=Peribacillus cavernae TaxID=1674310 RepID=A0A3S0U1C4_9BACI|nr:MerR family transcriptional regulator [Peribacillus cavernae]MDQ0219975.1 MerR family mercuric resistance operon transcriptional regulator [Peribacillus cavernae]RUQ32040.1 MerR family transcriptional regulator [Peribacillus cavernae]
MTGLTIRQLAKASNVNIETVRYYERRGLISEPPRTESGYRMFPKEVIQDIQFIKRAQDLGFTLEEIKKILSASNNEESFHSEEMHEFATEKIREIEVKIHKLNNMKSVLEDLTAKCPGSEVPKNQCPIIKNLSEGEIKNV